MIRVNRGLAPSELAIEEASRLPIIEALVSGGQGASSDSFEGYRCAAEPLFQVQHSKCVYCEKKIERKYQDVEHFRPKARADRSPGSLVTSGYWWLAWCWENLYFSCPNCNRAPAKLDQFPLALGSAVLQAKDPPPGLEDALLIDPSREDPLDHIWFRPCPPGESWRPVAKTEKGEKTIRVCQLARPDLLDQYKHHVEMAVRGHASELKRLAQQGSTPELTKAISRVSRLLLSAKSQFAGLSYDALRYLVGADPHITIPRPPII